jgi:hypothetical protein
MDNSFRQTAARVKGMQTIEDKVRATLRQYGLKLRPKDLAWNQNQLYVTNPDALELTVRVNGGPPVLQVFSCLEVERCARSISDPDTAIKIQSIAEEFHKLKPPG